MSIAITPFTNNSYYHRKKNLGGQKKSDLLLVFLRNQLPRTPYLSHSDAVNSVFNGHRVMIESGAGDSVTLIKNIAMLVQR
jgi:hypothetical protein